MTKYTTRFKRWLYSVKVQDEINSFLTTWASIMVVDGGLELINLYNGDFSTTAVIALLTAAFRSTVKAVLTLCFPLLFPKRSSGVDPVLSLETIDLHKASTPREPKPIKH